MTQMRQGRHTADLQAAGDEIVVFLIGMRINKPWKLRQWLPVFVAMPKMLATCSSIPTKGYSATASPCSPRSSIVQYWRSFADLERFARNPDDPHLEPWRKFNRMVKASGDVGIWHETYRVQTSNIETIYSNMPPVGLSKALGLIPVQRGQDTAAARLGARPADQPAVPTY